MSNPAPVPRTGVSLDVLLRALAGSYVELLEASVGTDSIISTVVLMDADDLRGPDRTLGEPLHHEASPHESSSHDTGPNDDNTIGADLVLHAGVSEAAARDWLDRVAALPRAERPRALMSKTVAGSTAIRQAARRAGVALVGVHLQTRWDVVLSAILGVLDSSLGRSETASSTGEDLGADTDLYGLAHQVATLTRGMVSIEDEQSRVLAYSASDQAADELRRLSILGREGPADYLRRLREWGVFEKLRRSEAVVEVPADESLGIRRRLVVGIHPVAGGKIRDVPLGAVWLQEGAHTLADDSEAVLRGAAAVAARLITRTRNAPSNEALQIQRLLGARGGGVDVVSLAEALSIPLTGPAVVIGFARAGEEHRTAADLASTLRLHASAFARDALVTAIGERSYVLLPRTTSLAGVTSWTGGVIERLAARGSGLLRAAVAAPVARLEDVPYARIEVDRVLDGTTGDLAVTTLADSRTPVLLGEIMAVLAQHPELDDPRLQALLDYDSTYGASMRETLETYLRFFGDVRRAAAELHIHPNTLRYRVKRAEEILDLDLTDPAGRLLVEIQLAVRRRSER